MVHRPAIRALLWGFCLAVALLSARSAKAEAPMCDENGTSRIAPSPILAIRDVRIDADFPSPCELPSVAVMPMGPRAAGGPTVVQDSVPTEAWVKPSAVRLPLPESVSSMLSFDASLPFSPGFRPSVFRPPRA